MPQRKLRPFVEVLNLVNSLTEEQRADLLDYLRGKQPKKERKTTKKAEKPEKADKPAKVEMCAICGNEKTFVDHQESSESYHIFRTSVKQKA